MLVFNESDYRAKVLGCWLGKNIGGTVGAPFEWKRQRNDVTFYTHALDGNPLPNDDLDLQLLWLVALEEQGVHVDAKILADYWMLYVTPHWSEYGVAKANMKAGLMPPLSGTAHNAFKDSCGAFIRSEIWACIAPGCPDYAARYAYEDAIIDHGNGEGMYAALFCAAMESAAFVVSDVGRLIDIGLSYIPEQCGVSGAVRNVVASRQAGKTWEEARDALALRLPRQRQLVRQRLRGRSREGICRRAAWLGCSQQHRHDHNRACCTAKATSRDRCASPSIAARIRIAPRALSAPSSASCTASKPYPSAGSSRLVAVSRQLASTWASLGTTATSCRSTIDALTDRVTAITRRVVVREALADRT